MDRHSNTDLQAIGCIEIRGLARDNGGNPMMLRVPREDSLTPQIEATCDPATLPALSPPPSKGDAVLSLSVGDKIHEDEYGTIYKVCVTNKVKSDVVASPLVIKVAARLHGRRVAQEGGVYDALRSLQGNITPRCYGYFRTKINHQELTIKPWDGPECDREKPRPPLDVFDMPNVASSLNILLLEEVGPNAFPQHTSSESVLQSFTSELTAMYDRVMALGIMYSASDSEEVMFGKKVCSAFAPSSLPKDRRGYNWRLVGFGEAKRCSLEGTEKDSEIFATVMYMIGQTP